MVPRQQCRDGRIQECWFSFSLLQPVSPHSAHGQLCASRWEQSSVQVPDCGRVYREHQQSQFLCRLDTDVGQIAVAVSSQSTALLADGVHPVFVLVPDNVSKVNLVKRVEA